MLFYKVDVDENNVSGKTSTPLVIKKNKKTKKKKTVSPLDCYDSLSVTLVSFFRRQLKSKVSKLCPLSSSTPKDRR